MLEKLVEKALTVQQEVEAEPHVERTLLPYLRESRSMELYIGSLEAERALQNPMLLKIERRPETMIADVCRRLDKSCISEAEWFRADISRRGEMLRTAMDIMAQEMCLPREIRHQLQLRIEPLKGASGQTPLFIDLDAQGGPVEMIASPVVKIHEDRLIGASAADSMSTLFHEMLHVMQQVSLMEKTPWSPDVPYWLESAKNYGNFKRLKDYFLTPIEAYTHANDALFKKTFIAYNIPEEYDPFVSA